MRWALTTRMGQTPAETVLALALAKSALETGRWTSIWNSNWGNVKASETYEGMYTCITLNELLKRQGKVVAVWFAPEGELSGNPAKGGRLIGKPLDIPPGHPQTRMRAFANNWDGVDQYVEFVAGKYPNAWQALLTGSAEAYVRELKKAGYFTAVEAVYLRGVVALQREMIGRLQGVPGIDRARIEWEQLADQVPGLQFDLASVTEVETSARERFGMNQILGDRSQGKKKALATRT